MQPNNKYLVELFFSCDAVANAYLYLLYFYSRQTISSPCRFYGLGRPISKSSDSYGLPA